MYFIDLGMIQSGTDAANAALGLIHRVRSGQSEWSPLVVLLHGRCGTVDSMSIFCRTVPAEWGLLILQAPDPDPLGDFSWWPVSDDCTYSGDRSPMKSAWKLVDNTIGRACEFYGWAPERMYGVGFSQGGALLSIPAQLSPRYFNGIAFLATLVIRVEEDDVAPSEQFVDCELFWAHGAEDPVITVARAKEDFLYLKELGYTGSIIEDPVGHKIGREGMRELKSWFSGRADG